jgi:hypothetical protein
MGLGDFFQAVVDTVTLPIDVARDVVDTAVGDGEATRTKDKIEKIQEELGDTFE